MPSDLDDLHGNVPDTSGVVLILIDVINDLEFDGGEQLLEHALPSARQIVTLRKRAKALDIPVIYANDNFGRWRSDFAHLVERCLTEDVRGRPIVEMLRPEEDDYFVLKPSYSAFYATPLDLLLDALQARTLILAGFAGNRCVLFTANDAYMRGYRLVIPADCQASNTVEENEVALYHFKQVLGATVTPSARLDLDRLRREDQPENLE
jgi:nicotinamidase-related amidase